MPYLGNTAGNRFVASKAATQFSGNGSNTSFTLEHAVGSDEDILVSVDGVIQEPSVAYSVSNGTTLTFTAAPSNNSGNNIFVYYLFRTVGTVDHPATNALQAANGTFTGDLTVDTSTLKVDSTNNRVGVGTASPSDPFHVTASSGSRMARFEASQANSFIAFKDSNTNVMPTIGCTTDALELKTASSGDPVIGLKIDANGVVTTPKIPMMLAQGGRTVISTGTTDFWYLALPERYDTTNSYDASTGIFTAPVAGKYFVYSHLKISSSQSNAHFAVSVNSAYQGGGGGYDANNAWQIQTGDYMQWTGMVNVSANDTIRMVLYPDGVKNALDSGTNRNHFVVYLVG